MAPEALVTAATVVLVALGFLFGFSNGFHDAANAVATVIATKSLTPRQAVYSSALFNFLPCLVLNTAVANTIAKIVSTTCVSSTAQGLTIPISDATLPLPMIAGKCSIPPHQRMFSPAHPHSPSLRCSARRNLLELFHVERQLAFLLLTRPHWRPCRRCPRSLRWRLRELGLCDSCRAGHCIIACRRHFRRIRRNVRPS